MQKSTKTTHSVYKSAVSHIIESKIPFMVGGAFALFKYTGIYRDTKDLDIFIQPKDYETLLTHLNKKEYKTEVTDTRWLVKAFRKHHLIDIIFGSLNGLCPVEETWFAFAPWTQLFGHKVRLMPPEEMIWQKAFVQTRDRFDGADIQHIILKKGKTLDWKRLLTRMDRHWEILLAHLIVFRFVYPSHKNLVPKWLMTELLARESRKLTTKSTAHHISQGPLLSPTEYKVDINKWGFMAKKAG